MNFLDYTYGIEKFLPYEESEKIVHKQKFKNVKEYNNWKDRPNNIPSNPQITYKNKGWEGWGKYLGTGNVAPSDIKFLPYEKAKKIVCKKGFKNVKEYNNWKDRPNNIPSNPQITYKNKGWEGWGKYLGTGNVASSDIKFLPYEESEKIVHKQKFKNLKEYYNWKDRPYNIPSNPHITYKNNGWEGFGKYLGTGNVAPSDIKFLPYEKAKKIVHKQKFKNLKEYYNWKDRPYNIPSNPNRTYKNKGWEGWGKYLGTGNVAPSDKEFLPYEESEKIVCKQKFKSAKEYNNWKDRPNNIPSNPYKIYKNNGWEGFGKYLGNKRRKNLNIN